MLVLSRKANDEILIGPDVRLVVLGVQGNRVRLGISAPDDVTIRRGETEIAAERSVVWERMRSAETRRDSFLEN